MLRTIRALGPWRASRDAGLKRPALAMAALGCALACPLARADPSPPWTPDVVGSGASLTPLLVGAGLVAGSALLDRPLDDYARRHGDNPSARALRRVGNTLPVVGIGVAGLSWLAQRGSTQGDVAFSALGAGVSALALTGVGKLVVDRARPDAELGPASFGEIPKRSGSSFPSGHSALAWAVLTPYAKHHDMPWLYGVAALTNTARVLGRAHWVSDTVAGAALGYWLGDRFYRQSGASSERPRVQLSITPGSLLLQVPFE